jgi:hypothetical protein
VNQTETSVVELVIGLGCLVAAAGAFRRSKLLTGVLAVAGLAAVIHAVAALFG